MGVRIRNTEKHPHPVWDQLIKEFPVAELQGFVLSSTDEVLIQATKNPGERIPVQCFEAIEYDAPEELAPEHIFSEQDWELKIKTAAFFCSSLMLLTHRPHADTLIDAYTVTMGESGVAFQPYLSFKEEKDFMAWWVTIKLLAQTKKTVEAAPRQAATMFDRLMEKHGYSWGGNMDGFILSPNHSKVLIILEVRQTHTFPIGQYDPAHYFKGTNRKGGDFKTWLPLVYLRKNFNLPIVLLTLSSREKGRFGYAEVLSINHDRLFYMDNVPPTHRITDNFSNFRAWLHALIERSQSF